MVCTYICIYIYIHTSYQLYILQGGSAFGACSLAWCGLARHGSAAAVLHDATALHWRRRDSSDPARGGGCFLVKTQGTHTDLPSGKHTKNYGKSQFLMGKLTISMAIFNSYVSHYQRVTNQNGLYRDSSGIWPLRNSHWSTEWDWSNVLNGEFTKIGSDILWGYITNAIWYLGVSAKGGIYPQ